jgi:hypothetical protein
MRALLQLTLGVRVARNALEPSTNQKVACSSHAGRTIIITHLQNVLGLALGRQTAGFRGVLKLLS